MSNFIHINDISADERTKFFQDLIPNDLLTEKGNHLIGALDKDGYPEGVLVFCFNSMIVDMMYIEVYAPLRRNGIGTKLINALTDFLLTANMPFILESSYMVTENSEAMAKRFFTKNLQVQEIFTAISFGRIV